MGKIFHHDCGYPGCSCTSPEIRRKYIYSNIYSGFHEHDSDEAEAIIGGAQSVKGELLFLVKWNNSEKCRSFMPAEKCKTRFPQLVISFYEKYISFEDNPEDRTPTYDVV